MFLNYLHTQDNSSLDIWRFDVLQMSRLELSWVYWDPNRALLPFNIPLLDRPVLWYGFLFALGFFFGYWIIVYILRRYFLYFPAFHLENIDRWPELLRFLQTQELKVPLHLPPGAKKQLAEFKQGKRVDPSLQKAILDGLNRAVKEGELWPHHPASPWTQRLLRFANNRVSAERLSQIRNRLLLEERLQGMVFSLKQRSAQMADRLTLYMVIATVIGARLGDLLFYQNWEEVMRDPSSIVKVWEGGLASHGGAIGILVAIFLFAKRAKSPLFTFLKTLDLVAIPTACAAVFIRIGNFFNQEILGIPSTLPWAVIFGHPFEGGAVVPRHPAQLYEALAYLLILLFLFWFWLKHPFLKKGGQLVGLFLVLVFSARFLIEFAKPIQGDLFGGLRMGQLLSIPLIVLGGWLLVKRAD